MDNRTHNRPSPRGIALLLLCSLVLLSGTLYAEGEGPRRNTFSDSYLGIGLRGGVGGMFSSGSLSTTMRPGYSYGIDLCYMGEMGRFYGFIVGISYAEVNFALDAKGITASYETVLRLGGTSDQINYFDLDATVEGTTERVHEVYKTHLLELPVLFTFAYDNWYSGVGVKFALPLRMTADYSVGDTERKITRISTTGTVIEDDKSLGAGTLPGFDGRYTVFGSGGKMVPITVMATIEVGYRLQFALNNSLQFSLFGEIGLGSIQLDNAADDKLLTLDGDNISYRGLAMTGDLSGLTYFKTGLRVQYNLGLGKAPRSGNPLKVF